MYMYNNLRCEGQRGQKCKNGALRCSKKKLCAPSIVVAQKCDRREDAEGGRAQNYAKDCGLQGRCVLYRSRFMYFVIHVTEEHMAELYFVQVDEIHKSFGCEELRETNYIHMYVV